MVHPVKEAMLNDNKWTTPSAHSQESTNLNIEKQPIYHYAKAMLNDNKWTTQLEETIESIISVKWQHGRESYLISDSPFTTTQRLMIVVYVAHIQAATPRNLVCFLNYSVNPNKGIIITLHDALCIDSANLRNKKVLMNQFFQQPGKKSKEVDSNI